MEEKTFASLGRVEAIRQLFEGTGFQPFCEPLWFEAKAGDCITSATKVFLEGIDFNLVYFPLKHLGYKSVITTAGELYAVMATPATLSVTIGVSAKLDFSHIEELWSGVTAAAREQGFKSLSLELQPSKNGLCISVTASGSCSKLSAVRRPKAQSKDLICVSGSLGAAFLGMKVLEKGMESFSSGQEPDLERYKMLVGAYLKPDLGARTVAQLEDSEIYPSCGYFVTRGLSDAVKRLSRDSGLGAKIYASKIPFEGNSFQLGREMDIDPISAAMNGGDDCKLLFTIPILSLDKFRHDFQTFDIIGHLALPEVGTVLVTPDGVELPLRAQGWKEE